MRRRWRQPVLLALAVLLAASWGLSRALEDGWARRSLVARLAASFGRPVEVGRFGFNLLSGLRLEARSVTVSEDPRFGREYFLRAERLTASVRWTALARGRFEFDTVSLTRPSLNLVRTADGRWNIQSWLPPAGPGDTVGHGPAGVPSVLRVTSVPTARLSRIEVENGRINFKRDSSKMPLALVAVRGRLDQDGAGHWNIDLEANPMRAPVVLQQAGTLRLRGTVAGVSARLRPAALTLTWEEASLADLSRLVRGRDYGVRGTLAAELSARIEDLPAGAAGGQWSVEGTFRFRGLHGWALAGRAGDPGFNASIQARWRPGEPRLVISRCLVEAPQSRLNAIVEIDWSHGFRPYVQLVSSRVALADLLAWPRAFLPGIADDLAMDGAINAEATLSGWPLRIEQAALVGTRAVIRSAALPGPVRVGPLAIDWARNSFILRPVSVVLPVAVPGAAPPSAPEVLSLPAGSLSVEGLLGPFVPKRDLRDLRYQMAVSGAARRSQDLVAIARALGWSADSAWTAEGPVSFHLAWTGALRQARPMVEGTVEVRDLRVTSALLNQPLVVSSASVELRRGLRRVNLSAMQAIGARWTGSLSSPANGGPWDFDLSADRLDTADLDRWLGPRARPNLFLRMLPFATIAPSIPPMRAEAFGHLQARGRLRVGELLLAPLRVERLNASVAIEGRNVVLRRARAELYGGQLAGELEARLAAEPAYSFEGQLLNVDLRELAAASSLPGQFRGIASGELKLAARGIGRAALVDSLAGEGTARVRQASFAGIGLQSTVAIAPAEPEPGAETRRYSVTARFQVGDRSVRLDQLLLARPGERSEVAGSVDFARRLDLRVHTLSRPLAAADAGLGGERDAWIVGGTLEAPRITPQPVLGNRSGSPVVSR